MSDYWKKRFQMLEEASNRDALEAYRQIEPSFVKAQRQIEKEINTWVARVAVNNEVTMSEAKKLLSSKELAEFKWDVNQYIEAGRKHGSDPVWMKQLENASARFHISKLEALQIRTQEALETAFGNETDIVDSMVRKTYSDGYYKTLYEVQKGFNTGWEVGQIDQRKLDKIVSSPWTTDGKTFSNRIWDRKTQMVGELQNQLLQTCILGKTPDDAVKSLEQYVDKSVKNAENAARRLVMTEQAYFHSESQKEAFKELGVEQYEIVATLDSKTSEICQEMDGQVFDMKDFESGVTAPPFHVYCRSVVAPYFPDDFGEIGQRVARDEVNDKTYYVPADMKYPEWKKAFVDGDTSGLTPKTNAQNGDIIKEVVKAEVLDDKVDEVVEQTEEPEPIVDNREYKYATNEEYTNLSRIHAKNISKEDREQIQKHTKKDGSPGGYVATHNYATINSNMREDGFSLKGLDEDDQKTIVALRKAIASNELDADYILTRNVNADYLTQRLGLKCKLWKKGDDEALSNSITQIANPYVVNTEIPRITKELQSMVGQKIPADGAFMSTSMIPEKNIMNDKSVQFVIHAPKGTKAYLAKNRKESECILAEDVEMIIEDVQYNSMGRKWIFTVRIDK